MKKVFTVVVCLMMLFTQSCAKDKTEIAKVVLNDNTKYEASKEKVEKVQKDITVIIDPGHGFIDPGSTPEYLSSAECDVTLKAAEIFAKVLNDRGIRCILTHDGESYPDAKSLLSRAEAFGVMFNDELIIDDEKFSPYERSIYANVLSRQYTNCFFVSLHTNAVENAPDVHGASIDWYDGNPYAEKLSVFADDLSNRLEKSPGTALKLFEDDFYDAYVVTKYTETPAVLIEMGYGTNATDAANMQNDAWLKAFLSSLADAIEEYYK